MTSQERSELLPCPFCGGAAALHENDYCEPPEWSVYCTTVHCAASAASRVKKSEAIAAWNLRPAPSPSPDLGEAVEAARRLREFLTGLYGVIDVGEINSALDFLLSLSARVDARAETIEECAKECEIVGADWDAAGELNKFYAAKYLAQHLRSLLSAGK